MQCPLNDFALQPMIQIHKVFAVTGNSDHQIPVLFRMNLCVPQILRILIIDLNLRSLLLQIDLQHPDNRLRSFPILHKGRTELKVQCVGTCNILMGKLQDGIEQRRRALRIRSLRRPDAVRNCFAGQAPRLL